MTREITELTDRMREIFGLVVESYLERGAPVGSKMLTGSISLSPASIRGVMQELEERGLLTHPHTSAGRIPTESGLRLFVDGIMQASAPDPRVAEHPQEQLLVIAVALGGHLRLDDASVGGEYEIAVAAGSAVFVIIEIEDGGALEHAAAHGGDLRMNRVFL